jgi:hypothetical protein
MRILISLLSLVVFSAASAADVTFDDMAATGTINCVDELGNPMCQSVQSPQGFIFTTDQPLDPYKFVAVMPGNFQQGIGSNFLWGGSGWTSFASSDLIISHASGNAFDVHSLDTFLTNVDESNNTQGNFISAHSLIFKGYDSSGNLIASLTIEPPRDASPSAWINQVFDNDWNAIHKLEITEQQIHSQWGVEAVPVSLDNFSATIVLNVGIDVQPGDPDNFVQTDGSYSDKMHVSIEGSETFDATQVHVPDVRFGPANAMPHPANPFQVSDTNNDGFPDMKIKFRVADTGLTCDMTGEEVLLRTVGNTNNLPPFESVDTVTTQACEPAACHP